AAAFPNVDFRREVTVGHLLLDVDAPAGTYAKVNPPIRSRADVEYLWQAGLARPGGWVVRDPACCAGGVQAPGGGGGANSVGRAGARAGGTCGLRSRDSAARSTCWPACSARGADGACRCTASRR